MDGLNLPQLILGTMDRRQGTDGERIELFIEAFESGLTAFDTAPLYNFGGAEKQLGKALDSIPRELVLVLTKVGLRWDGDAHGDVLFEYADDSGNMRRVRKDSRPESILQEVDMSLDRLGLETLDLVQIHHPDRHVPIGESMGALLDLMHGGKLRHIGVSNFTPQEVSAAHAALGEIPLATVQQDYSLVRREIECNLIPLCQAQSIDLIVYSPLGEGMLAGKPAPSSHKGFQQIADVVKSVLLPIADRHNVSLAAVALAWVTGRSGITSAITGASTSKQLQDQAQAFQCVLLEEEMDELTRAFAKTPLPFHWELQSSQLERMVRTCKAGLGSALRRMGMDPGKIRRRLRSSR